MGGVLKVLMSVTDKVEFVQLKQEIIESFRNKKRVLCVKWCVKRKKGVCVGRIERVTMKTLSLSYFVVLSIELNIVTYFVGCTINR